MLTRIKKCPDWPLVRIVHQGSWTNPICELFGEDGETPTHVHIYKPKVFIVGDPDGTFVLPPSVKTVSFDD